jgi:hypothetical protein
MGIPAAAAFPEMVLRRQGYGPAAVGLPVAECGRLYRGAARVCGPEAFPAPPQGAVSHAVVSAGSVADARAVFPAVVARAVFPAAGGTPAVFRVAVVTAKVSRFTFGL